MHSALGRFFDQPLDLAVGLVDPDGAERILPFSQSGRLLHAPEQFERINSITFRGHSEVAGLRFELNFHSPFYPQNESLSLLPAIYVELRVTWADEIRRKHFYERQDSVQLFIRLKRPQSRIDASPGRIDLAYDVPLDPQYKSVSGASRYDAAADQQPRPPVARVMERIQSINDGSEPLIAPDGSVGLALSLPVTEEGSGIKWRLVWAAHTADPVLQVKGEPARLRYLRYWKNLDAVIAAAIGERDDRLILSRRFEKLLEQAPLDRSQWHLLVMAFQSYLSNTFWCDLDDQRQFFSVWEGNQMYHNTLDVAYNMSVFYLALWPQLLCQSLDQWAVNVAEHAESGGIILHHDLGRGCRVDGPAYRQLLPVEENSNYLLMLQAYVHWTGDLEPARAQVEVVRRAARYLLWSDRHNCGFPTEGAASTLADGNVALHAASRQTYLAIKRMSALDAAGDLLERTGHHADADAAVTAATEAVRKIEAASWLGDHYAVCVDPSAGDSFGDAILLEDKGWDSYCIHTANALLLPSLIGQPTALNKKQLAADLASAQRETLGNYGCGHTSTTAQHVWISQNLWRDLVSRYLRVQLPALDERYWDLITFSNSGDQSLGYSDTYLFNELVFNPRGVTAFGAFLAGPRLMIDRLDEEIIAVDPDRHRPQRWPLFPLADWRTGKIPICVVDSAGKVRLEGGISNIKIIEHGVKPAEDSIG